MRRLLPSIHDVGPRFEEQIDALADRLTHLLGRPGFAMLVVPDHWGEAPLARAPAYAAKLRGWADQGVEMFVHGFSHRDDAAVKGFAQRHMTAGEGEFAALDDIAARAKIRDGRKIVEDAIGRPVAGFIAPAWLYSRQSIEAVKQAGFALAEDHMKVWNPHSGQTLARGPVITWASRSPARIRSSLMLAKLVQTVPLPWPVVRVAVHPGDTGVPMLLDSIDKTIGRLMQTRIPSRYADLLA